MVSGGNRLKSAICTNDGIRAIVSATTMCELFFDIIFLAGVYIIYYSGLAWPFHNCIIYSPEQAGSTPAPSLIFLSSYSLGLTVMIPAISLSSPIVSKKANSFLSLFWRFRSISSLPHRQDVLLSERMLYSSPKAGQHFW